eukprot:TRINITY_DN4616_c0_g2_i1.p1 TRINITY_DN4616_c0_g2~~TRINITY_DN4616_c0_g2_i1.p1  ORF type:complete len:157 (+),score=23.35 TRINITY_DN4616_c0_g2_i1:584-1054(+)
MIANSEPCNKRSNLTMLKNATLSTTVCDLMPFDLPTILDTSLDEESLSPTENRYPANPVRNARKSEAERMSLGLAFAGLRPSCPEKKTGKILIGMKPTRESVLQANKKKAKAKTDENARKHQARSYLNELYAKVLMSMRAQERNKRHVAKSYRPKH